MIPPEQYLDDYVLFTTHVLGDGPRRGALKAKFDGKFHPVTLDCAGELGDWVAVGDYGLRGRIFVTGNFVDVGNCSNSHHG